MLRRLAILVSALTLASQLASATASAATIGNGNCDSGNICVFNYDGGPVADYAGGDLYYAANYTNFSDPDTYYNTGGATVDNTAGSVRNRDSSYTGVCVYKNGGQVSYTSSDRMYVSYQYSVYVLLYNISGWNNVASSHRRVNWPGEPSSAYVIGASVCDI